MIISNVNIGSGPGANDGESIYSAFYKVNQNFANVQSNVNSLTNSVSSVAGRTGNVTLTINDIVGLNTTYSTQANLTTANVAMRGYVDAKIAANVASLVDSAPGILDTLNELAAAINDDASFSTTIINTINLANTIQSQQIAAANIGVIGYVDLANTIQSQQMSAANLGMKGYVDSVATLSIYGNANVASYLPTHTGNLSAKYANISGDTGGLNAMVVGLPGIETFGNVVAQFHANINSPAHVAVHNKSAGDQAVSGFMATADIGDENENRVLLGITNSGYNPTIQLKPLDSLLLAVGGNLVIGTNNLGNASVPVKDIVFSVTNGSTLIPLRINATDDLSSANLELGSNVGILFSDGTRQTSAYSNVQTATFTNLSTYAYNANVTAANVGMKGYVDSVASQSIYGNANVASYLTGGFDGNIIPSANVTYSLGSITNRWKDLYLSGNTIFLGDATITTSGGAVLTPVTRQLFTQSFLPGSTNSAATFTLDRLPTTGSTRTVVVIGVQSGPSPAPSYTLTEGVDFTISGLSLIITTSYTATNISCTESYSDTGDLITATEVATDTITPGSGDLTVSGNVTVDGDLYVSPTSIYMGNLRISAADGNLKVNTGIKFSDDTVQTTAYTGSTYSNVQVATYLPTYTGNIQASNVFSDNFSATGSGNMLSLTTRNGDSNNSYASPQITMGYAGTDNYPSFIHTTHNAGTPIDNTIEFWTCDGSQFGTFPANVVLGLTVTNGNIKTGGILTNNYYYANGTPVSFGGSSYSNVEVGVFTNLSNYAYNANVTAANVGMKGYVDSLTYSNVQAESFITTFSGNVPQASLAYTVNISPVIVNLEYQLALLPAKEGAWGIKAADGTANVTYNPVSNRLTSANVQATGSIQTSGINGRIGYSAGGFVQQITANSNGVSLNTVTGNIQLMGINLGVNGLHTVSFTNNKLEETDLILVSHHSGGVSNFAVGAYYAAPSTAIIWIRNITGADTSTVTPMLKFALIKAPGS